MVAKSPYQLEVQYIRSDRFISCMPNHTFQVYTALAGTVCLQLRLTPRFALTEQCYMCLGIELTTCNTMGKRHYPCWSMPPECASQSTLIFAWEASCRHDMQVWPWSRSHHLPSGESICWTTTSNCCNVPRDGSSNLEVTSLTSAYHGQRVQFASQIDISIANGDALALKSRSLEVSLLPNQVLSVKVQKIGC